MVTGQSDLIVFRSRLWQGAILNTFRKEICVIGTLLYISTVVGTVGDFFAIVIGVYTLLTIVKDACTSKRPSHHGKRRG